MSSLVAMSPSFGASGKCMQLADWLVLLEAKSAGSLTDKNIADLKEAIFGLSLLLKKFDMPNDTIILKMKKYGCLTSADCSTGLGLVRSIFSFSKEEFEYQDDFVGINQSHSLAVTVHELSHVVFEQNLQKDLPQLKPYFKAINQLRNFQVHSGFLAALDVVDLVSHKHRVTQDASKALRNKGSTRDIKSLNYSREISSEKNKEKYIQAVKEAESISSLPAFKKLERDVKEIGDNIFGSVGLRAYEVLFSDFVAVVHSNNPEIFYELSLNGARSFSGKHNDKITKYQARSAYGVFASVREGLAKYFESPLSFEDKQLFVRAVYDGMVEEIGSRIASKNKDISTEEANKSLMKKISKRLAVLFPTVDSGRAR
jgi:hypothetical protein